MSAPDVPGRAFKSRLSLLVAGGIGKIAYGAVCFALVASGVGRAMVLTAGIVDVLMGLAFAAIVLSDSRRELAGQVFPA